MVYYKPVKVTINALGLTKVIIAIIAYHYKVTKSIVIDQNLLFIS